MKVQVIFPDGRKAWISHDLAESEQVVSMGGRILEPLPKMKPIGFEIIGSTEVIRTKRTSTKKKAHGH